MADIVITVRGSSSSIHPPERATVSLSVAVEGATKDGVFSSASQTASLVAAQIQPMADRDRGPVTQWSSDQVRTWSHRPWNDAGRQLPQVHHAGVDFRVTFSDFAALTYWLSAVAPLTGVTVGGLEWTITEARCIEYTELVRAAAVHDAREKARSYARSLGLSDVRPLAIADVGMLGDATEHLAGVARSPVGAFAAHRIAADDSSPELNLTPQDITITAAVDARFAANYL